MTHIHLLHSHFDQDHLDSVISEMEKMGAPTIRCYELFDGMVQAIEGCHRLRAAEQLDITVNIEIIDPCVLISDLDNLDCDRSDDTIESLGGLDNDSVNLDVNWL